MTVTFASLILAAMPSATLAGQQTQPDNTRVNERDRSNTQPTADQAKNKTAM
jgi:hypothetical protein